MRDLETNPLEPSAEEKATYAESSQSMHRSYVLASIFTTSAFLDATVNELYTSAEYPNLELGGKLPEAQRELLVDAWPTQIKEPILERYQKALTTLSLQPMARGEGTFQNAFAVLDLRNELMHYKPRWRDTHQLRQTSRVETSGIRFLESNEKRFARNPFTGSGNPTLDRSLCYALAAWSLSSALAFTDEFFKRVGVEARYASIREDLKA
ncbi:hypothetical protein ACFWP7_42010 [Streptomyces sp. NPDC058470]|uniref:hypothetical protein n=1 Tax=Streptomyces sp. NPDC058470 TaxID=3346515 RepID=UPI00365F2E05